MRKNKLVNCPICNANKAINMLDLNCGNLDNSALYQSVKIVTCRKCGHIYNILSSREIAGLERYYEEESAPANISATDGVSDRPGSNSVLALKRYAQLYAFILPYIKNNLKILDGGCATGGFLDYLSKRGLKKLYGFDISEKYISHAKKKSVYDVRLGDVESIPFDDNSMNLVIMDQVLEHLVEPRKAFKETKRVLADGGLFCVSIPDASRYGKRYFFDFFWFLIREHIQHFDIEHLKLLAALEGFELMAYSKSETPMMSKKMILPVLSAVFRLTSKSKSNINKDCFRLKKQIKHYISNNLEKLNKKRKIIDDLVVLQKPLYVWGIGKEFMYLYESAGLKKCNIAGLIDISPYKQKKYSVDGKKIEDKSILKKAAPNSALIISAVAHTEQINDELLKMDYRGQIIKI